MTINQIALLNDIFLKTITLENLADIFFEKCQIVVMTLTDSVMKCV